MVRFPKLAEGEIAAEIDTPFELVAEDGDRITATITNSGTVRLQALEPEKVPDLGSVDIVGFAPAGAQAVAKNFWSWLWGKIKSAARAVISAITFDGGPLGSCRADVTVTHVDGVPTGGTVGISCAN